MKRLLPLCSFLFAACSTSTPEKALPPCCQPGAAASAAASAPTDSLAHLEGAWRDHEGTDFTFEELEGAPRLVSMFFSHCTYACPRLIEDARLAQAAILEATGTTVPVWLFSMDDRRDTPEALAAFGKARGLDLKTWRLLHATAGDVAELAAALGIQYRLDPKTGDFGHTSRLVLLDRQGRPVGAVEGAGPDLKPLVDAARRVTGTPATPSTP